MSKYYTVTFSVSWMIEPYITCYTLRIRIVFKSYTICNSLLLRCHSLLLVCLQFPYKDLTDDRDD